MACLVSSCLQRCDERVWCLIWIETEQRLKSSMGSYLLILTFSKKLLPETAQISRAKVDRGKPRKYALHKVIYTCFEWAGTYLYIKVTKIANGGAELAAGLSTFDQHVQPIARERKIWPRDTTTDCGHDMRQAPVN